MQAVALNARSVTRIGLDERAVNRQVIELDRDDPVTAPALDLDSTAHAACEQAPAIATDLVLVNTIRHSDCSLILKLKIVVNYLRGSKSPERHRAPTQIERVTAMKKTFLAVLMCAAVPMGCGDDSPGTQPDA